MIIFIASVTSDAAGALIAPLFIFACQRFYDESMILNRFGIMAEYSDYFLTFYLVMVVFQVLIDMLSVNIADLFHRWQVLDYLEFCQYRFKTRTDVMG